MYTSYIGKKFLRLYNERCGKTITAEEFFDKEFFPLFFNDERHLMHVSNSPFFQKPKPIDIEKFGSKSLAQYDNLKTAIESDIPNMSIYVGAGSKDINSTTSGQISNIELNTTKDDIYASWIGEALGIGISGGLVMLIDEEEVLWTLYAGWKYYRKYLTQTPYIKDKQIETWNGQWIWHTSQSYYEEAYPLDNFEVDFSEIQGRKAISTSDWIKVVFALANKYPSETVTAYSYNLSQTNTTLGFIKLYLPEVHVLSNQYDQLFPEEASTAICNKGLESYSSFYTYKAACSFGAIGLKTFEPAKLREYMPKGSVMYAQGKDYKFNNEESYVNYKQFKTWIIAMLNKMELLQIATKIAEVLILIENEPKRTGTDRGKNDVKQKIKEFLNTRKREDFIEGLKEMLEKAPDNKETLRDVMKEVLMLPIDLLPLFITLVRFEYSYLNK